MLGVGSVLRVSIKGWGQFWGPGEFLESVSGVKVGHFLGVSVGVRVYL